MIERGWVCLMPSTRGACRNATSNSSPSMRMTWGKAE